MDTGNFSYLSPDLFGICRNSHRLQCTHCARCDFQNLLKNIRLYDPKNLRNALYGFAWLLQTNSAWVGTKIWLSRAKSLSLW